MGSRSAVELSGGRRGCDYCRETFAGLQGGPLLLMCINHDALLLTDEIGITSLNDLSETPSDLVFMVIPKCSVHCLRSSKAPSVQMISSAQLGI